MPKVTFVNGKDKTVIEVPAGANLRAEAQKAGVVLYPGPAKYFNCRGMGTCGTCKVVVQQGLDNVGPKALKERVRLAMMPFATIGHEHDLRLACQCTVNGDCTVETKPTVDFAGENFWQKPYPNK